MKIYLVSQTKNQEYDSYDSFVVVAESTAQARRSHPDNFRAKRQRYQWVNGKGWCDMNGVQMDSGTWVKKLTQVKVKCLGEALTGQDKHEIICASFNAG